MNEMYSLVTYTQEKITHGEGGDLADLLGRVEDDGNTWLTVDGHSATDRDAIAQLFSFFNIDPSLADTIVDEKRMGFNRETKQYLFVDYATPYPNPAGDGYCYARGSIIFNHQALILFDRDRSGYFDSIRNKILAGDTRVQEFGPDYLFYLWLRTAIAKSKRFMSVDLVEQFEAMEDEVIDHPGQEFVLDDIMTLRQQVRPLYESILSLRELIDHVLEEESRFIAPHTRRLFEKRLEKDSDQLWQSYVQLRDWNSELMDIHRSNVAEKTNRILHILTILSFVLLPITFISSLYGMNFAYMPVLQGRYSYYFVLGLMVLIVVVLLLIMKRKKWI